MDKKVYTKAKPCVKVRSGVGGNFHLLAMCPRCKKPAFNSQEHCPFCYQKLEWEGEAHDRHY